jgi:hypothetical protein
MKKLLLLTLLASTVFAEEPLSQEIIEFTIMGTGNNVTIEQVHQSKYINQTILGNNNTSVILQTGTGEKQVNSTISGNYNDQHITQTGSGDDQLDIILVGDHNSAAILQKGSVDNSATIHLENVGGPSSASLTQSGWSSSEDNHYGVTQFCANPAGCSVSVTQHPHY